MNVSFGSKNAHFNLSSLLSNIDTGDLYEGGRTSLTKRKRGFDDYDSDDDYSGAKSSDPNAFDSSAAKLRTNLIRSELNKRRLASADPIENEQISAETAKLAATTKLIEPFNKKIPTLTLKSRESWFDKICRIMRENCKLFNKEQMYEAEIVDACVKFEFEIIQKSKNIAIYQANCVRKYTEINKFTKENKHFLEDYLQNKKSTGSSETTHDEPHAEEATESVNPVKLTGFTSAKMVLNINNEAQRTPNRVEKAGAEAEPMEIESIVNSLEAKVKMEPRNELSLQTVSSLVVIELTKYYKAGKFLNKVHLVLS